MQNLASVKEVVTYTVDIFIAGEIADARRICREFCKARGLCVTVVECDFIYTGGAEKGVCVGAINYPRFPATPEAVWSKACDLAEELRVGLCQWSVCLVAPDKTLYLSERSD
jgi:hypothetical protein